MNFTHKKPNPIGSRKGFALILALGLMSLVLLLLVSFSALIQVESTASDNQRNSLIARQNALIGAYQALGALQQYAGPDRVVTARGDIYGRDVVHPLWTGVWSTTNATANPTWLVSGKYSEDASAFEVFPTSSSPFTQTVVISKANRPSTSNDGLFYDNGEVKVGRMNISSGDSSSGGYAWWVADEGTKASFARMNTTDGNTASVSDPTLTISSNSTVIARSRQYMLARAGLEDSLLNAVQTDGQLGGGSFEAYLDRGNNLDALMRLSSVKDLNYLDENLFPQSSLNGTSERNVSAYEHDFTACAYGVLINPAAPQGRPSLKMDLSTALAENSWVNTSGLMTLATASPRLHPDDYRSDKWETFAPALTAYFNLYRIATFSANSNESAPVMTVPMTAPVYYNSRGVGDDPSSSNIAQGTPIFSTAPVLSELCFTFAPYIFDRSPCMRTSSIQIGPIVLTQTCSAYWNTCSKTIETSHHGPDDYNQERPLEIRCFGFSEYWNPYTADVSPPKSTAGDPRHQGFFQVRVDGLPRMRLSFYSWDFGTNTVPSTFRDRAWVPVSELNTGELQYFPNAQSRELTLASRLGYTGSLSNVVVINLKLPETPVVLGAGETTPWSGLVNPSVGFSSNVGTYNILTGQQRAYIPDTNQYSLSAVYGLREQEHGENNNAAGQKRDTGFGTTPQYHHLGLNGLICFSAEDALIPWIGPSSSENYGVSGNTVTSVNIRYKIDLIHPTNTMTVSYWWVPATGANMSSADMGSAVFLSSYKIRMPADTSMGPTESGNAQWNRLATMNLYGRFGYYFTRVPGMSTSSTWLTSSSIAAPNNLVQETNQFEFLNEGSPWDIFMDTQNRNIAATEASRELLDKASGMMVTSSTYYVAKTRTVSMQNVRIPDDMYQSFPQRNPDAAAPLFELPTKRPVSMGSLQHLSLAQRRPFCIGNSWGFNMGPSAQQDVNELFDDFYITGLGTLSLNTLTVSYPFINSALFPMWSDGDALANETVDSATILGKFMVKGAFNLNSTSVLAWRAMLSGIWADEWNYTETEIASEPTTSSLRANAGTATLSRAYFRHSLTGDETYTANTDNVAYGGPMGVYDKQGDWSNTLQAGNPYHRGVRSVTQTQVASMASRIVELLQTRGQPFTSMADFLAPEGRSNNGQSVLENAIEYAGVNTAGWSIENNGGNPPPGSAAWLTQADIMTAIAPFLQIRSDTFKIRAYGDVMGNDGQIASTAICEMLVQRTPDPVTDSSDEEMKDPSGVGRKFKVISLSWVTN